MKKLHLTQTTVTRLIIIWTITVSVVAFISEARKYGLDPTNPYQTLAVGGAVISFGILVAIIRKWQTKELIKKMLNGNQLFSVLIGVCVGIASFLTLGVLGRPFSLPYSLFSGFTAGFVLYKLKGGLDKTWLKDAFVVGFLAHMILETLLQLPSILRIFSLLGGFESQFLNFLLFTGTLVLEAILWGTVSSIAGHLILKVNRRIIFVGVIALGTAIALAQIITQVTGNLLFSSSQYYAESQSIAPFFSLIGILRAAPVIIAQGIVWTCFLTIFQRGDALQKIKLHVNPDRLLLSIRFLVGSLPLSIKILAGYGILSVLGPLLYNVFSTSTSYEIYPLYLIISALVLGATFLTTWAFLKNPSTEKGIFLFGFTIASIYAILLLLLGYGGFSGLLFRGLGYVTPILEQLLFSSLIVSWIYLERKGYLQTYS